MVRVGIPASGVVGMKFPSLTLAVAKIYRHTHGRSYTSNVWNVRESKAKSTFVRDW